MRAWAWLKPGRLTVRQLHVNVPRRVGHDDCELSQHSHVEIAHVALHPLSGAESGIYINVKAASISDKLTDVV